MSKDKTQAKQTRRRHSAEYKDEALGLASRVGMTKAAQQLGLAESQLYYWRSKARDQMSQGDRESHQATELARLKRQLAEQQEELEILKKAAVYFAKASR